jgi:hypothetical protein
MMVNLSNRKILCLFVLFFVRSLYGQSLSKMVEYGDNNMPIKYNYLDIALNLIKAEFLNYKGDVMAEISYSKKGDISAVRGYKGKKIVFLYDLKLGVYQSAEDDVEVNFKNGLYNGVSKEGKVIVNYLNGKRNGEFIQADSAIIGSRPVVIQQVDIFALQYNILRFYNELTNMPVYKQFNGYRFKFSNDRIEGEQKAFYLNGKIKFTANFENNWPLYYESFDENGNTISKINFKNRVTINRFVFNGKVVEGQNVLYFKKLINAGVISQEYWSSDEKYNDYKKIFTGFQDDYKEILSFFKIPRFSITKFDLNFNDELSIIRIPVKKNSIIDSIGIELTKTCIFNEDTLYYKVFPFDFTQESTTSSQSDADSPQDDFINQKFISELQNQFKFENRYINTPDSISISKLMKRIIEYITSVQKLGVGQTQEIKKTEIDKYNYNYSALADYKIVYQAGNGEIPEHVPFFKVNVFADDKENYDELKTVYSELHNQIFYDKEGDPVLKIETEYNSPASEIVNIEVRDRKSIFKIKLIHFVSFGGRYYNKSYLLGITEFVDNNPIRTLQASDLLKEFSIHL